MKIKTIGYRLFGLTFSVFRLFGIRKKKVFLIATHEDGPEGNIAVTVRALKRMNPKLRFVRITKKDRGNRPFSFFFVKAYHMATAGTILLDNTFMPMAYTPISKKATVIQLWHGTGTIKKFGLDSDGEKVAKLARRGNKRIDWLIVNGDRTKRQYESAFGIPPEKIRPLGLPRTDMLLSESYMGKKRLAFLDGIREKVFEPELHRYVLYAPTFRDDELENPRLQLNLQRLMGQLPEDVILLLRFHPYVAEAFARNNTLDDLPKALQNRVFDVSSYPGTTTLLSVADVLVTDYSSIVFEYALLRRPMVFYAYDLEEFTKNGRDFYEPYEEFVPGPVVTDETGLARKLGEALRDRSSNATTARREWESRMDAFLRENYSRMDGKAGIRVAALALRDRKM